MERQQSRMEA